MKDDFSHMMTPFDQSVSTWSLQMTKLLIPFLPPQSQRMMAIYVKFIEFQNTLSFFRSVRQKKNSPEDIFNELKSYLPSSVLESYENIMNMMSMINMFQEMQTASDASSGFDPMSMMTDMLNPEQQDMFQMYQGMFAQENNTEQSKEGDSHA